MAFVKLDCGILNSTIWVDRPAREMLVTALLMAEPREVREPMEGINIRDLKPSGFVVPPGWYGFVPAAGPGIVHRAGLDHEEGMLALERLAHPEADSRTPDHEGRRMVRVDGGYIILNYDKYRQKDHTAAERSRRYRERKAARVASVTSRVTNRSVTQAEAEAEAEAEEGRVSSPSGSHPPSGGNPARKSSTWEPDETQLRLNALFRRRDSTRWSPKEIRAARAADIEEDDLKSVEAYYGAAPSDLEMDIRRRGLQTLLNNWQGEVDRANSYLRGEMKPKPKHNGNPQAVTRHVPDRPRKIGNIDEL